MSDARNHRPLFRTRARVVFRLTAISLAVLLASCLVLARGAPSARAEEPVEAFLTALRARGMHDVVISYLESLRAAGRLPEEMRDGIDYQLGLAHLEIAKSIRDPAQQAQDLQAAQDRFDAFLQAHGDQPQALDARMQLGVVTLWRGRNQLKLAERGGVNDLATRGPEARKQFDAAGKMFAAAKTDAEKLLESLPKVFDRTQQALKAQRDGAQDTVVRSQLYEAEAAMAAAESYSPGSKEHQEAVKAAGRKYAEIEKKYTINSAGGFLAGRGQAECLLVLGDKSGALVKYQTLIALSDVGDYLREQQAQMLPKVLQLMNEAETPDLDSAITLGENWLTAARGAAGETPFGLAIHYWVAESQRKKIEAIQADKERAESAEGKKEIRELGQKLIKHVELVASRRGEHQRSARDLLIVYRGASDIRPATFLEARDAGQSALDYFQQLSEPSSEELTPEQLEQREKDKQQSLTEAIDYFRLALSFGPEEATPDEVNTTRYFLCYSYFNHRDYYDALTVGEFVARRYPAFELAKPCAQLALEAARQIYFADQQGDRAFQTRQLEQMAGLITQKWPNSADADNAWMLLADLALSKSDYPRAATYLDKITDDSPRKGLAILKTGQALWGQYAIKSQPDKQTPQPELEALLQESEAKLTAGIEKARGALGAGDPPPYELLAAELSLAQLYSRTNRNAEGVTLLQKDRGVIKSLENWSGGGSPQFPQLAYRTALRCFVQAGDLNSALAIMDRLNRQAQGNPEAQRELTAIYLNLGNDLSEQLKVLQNDPSRRKQFAEMADGFRGVLDQIASNPEGAKFNELFWVASTYTTLGQTLQELEPEKSKACFRQAAALYDRVLNDPAVGAEYHNSLRVRLAESYRHEGTEESLQKGINLLLKVLNSQENAVDAQQEACQILERWGDLNHQASYFDLAINGYQDATSKKRLVWGWGTLASKVQRSETYKDTYFLARYNLAECRYKKAMIQSGAEQTKSLNLAKADLLLTVRVSDAELGGAEWKGKFDALTKLVQRELGEKPDGIKAFQQN